MNELIIINNTKLHLHLWTGQTPDSQKVTFVGSLDGDFGRLAPEQLLQVRDWINERCRELVFQGHLPESHPTA